MSQSRKLRRYVVAGFIAIGVMTGCADDDEHGPRNELANYDSEVATRWFALFNDITATERLTPPVASRAYAYEGVALYEATVGGNDTHQSLMGQLNELSNIPQASASSTYHWGAVANAALATISRRIYSDVATEASLQMIDDLEESFANQFGAETLPAESERSAAYGHAVGEAVYNWAFADGYFQLHNCAYVVPEGQGFWVPTPPAFLPPLEPCWGQLRNFVLALPGVCDPLPPPPFDENNPQAPFYQEVKEVHEVATALTEEQRDIALFWADGAGTMTPPGHWISILNQLATDNELTLDVAAEAYCRLGLAQGEAFISCWRCKYQHNLLRPITCIREMFDRDWNSPIPTPPFPEYTSGHSVQSAASAQVLTDLFDHTAFTDHTHDGRGLEPREFASFFDAADEAGISRLYGGIHFRSAIDNGLQQGICIGQKVSALQFEK